MEEGDFPNFSLEFNFPMREIKLQNSIPLDVFRLIAADSFLRSKYLNKISLMSVICFLSKFVFVLVFVIVVIE